MRVETEVAEQRQAAMAELEAARAAALGELKGDVAQLAVSAASKVVQADLDLAGNRRRRRVREPDQREPLSG